MTDTRLEIDESYGTVASYTYRTSIITLGDGTEQRNIEWRYPLGKFNLSKAHLCQDLLDYFLSFHSTMKGQKEVFRFRDYNDYETTGDPLYSGLNSYTQGVLNPAPDGSRKEFQLCKAYNLEGLNVFRIITRVDSVNCEVFINGNSQLVTIYPSLGKVVFLTAPQTNDILTWEGIFDIPVRFEQDNINYRLIGNNQFENFYSIEELSLIEIREAGIVANIGNFNQHYDHEFKLDLYVDSTATPSYETLVNKLDSGYERRDSQRNDRLAEWKLSNKSFCQEQTEYLLTLFRHCRGAGSSFYFRDYSGYKEASQPLTVRFKEDNLSIKFESYNGEDKIYTISGVDLKETNQPVTNSSIFGNTVNTVCRLWKLVSNKQYYEVCWSVNGVKSCLQNNNPITPLIPDDSLIPYKITWDLGEHIIITPNHYSYSIIPDTDCKDYNIYVDINNITLIGSCNPRGIEGNKIDRFLISSKRKPEIISTRWEYWTTFCDAYDDYDSLDFFYLYITYRYYNSDCTTSFEIEEKISGGYLLGRNMSPPAVMEIGVIPSDGVDSVNKKIRIFDNNQYFYYPIVNEGSVNILYNKKFKIIDDLTGETILLLDISWDTEFLIEPNTLTLGFTNHDCDINFSSLNYQAKSGFSPSAVTYNYEASVNNADINSILSSDAITELDITGGKWDNARLIIYLVNWRDVSKNYILFNGRLGETETSDRIYKAEARGLTQYLQQGRVRQTSAICHLKFGDNKCNKSLVGLTDTYTINGVTNSRQFTVTSSRPSGFFNQGTVYFLSGLNIGNTCDILSFDGSTFILWESMGFPIAIGDEITVTAGCYKTIDACESYGNAQNFGGTPFIPGADAYLKNI